MRLIVLVFNIWQSYDYYNLPRPFARNFCDIPESIAVDGLRHYKVKPGLKTEVVLACENLNARVTILGVTKSL